MQTFFLLIAAVLVANLITITAVYSFVSFQRRGLPLLDSVVAAFNTTLGVGIKLAAALFVGVLLLGLVLGLAHILIGQPT